MRQKIESQSEVESGAKKSVIDQQQAGPQKQGMQGDSTLRKLQRSRGNRFVQRLLKGATVQRSATGKEDRAGEVPLIVHEALGSPGRPLEGSTREVMESRFGEDFGDVRVHTDARAAESAAAIDARAYTAGSDIVFAEGEYAPGTSDGDRVIAHELAHVSQQGGERSDIQPLGLGPVDSAAEREADAAADRVANNRAVPETAGDHSGGQVRRAVAGGIVGGVLGAGAGAGLGFLTGGPVGAILGGLLGAAAGLMLGDVATSRRRSLTDPEKAEARLVFGNSLNLENVKVSEAPIMSVGGYARTLPDVVYLPPGALTANMGDYMPLLIHELTHVWQYQHGITVTTTLFHAIFSTYKYGGEQGLIRARAEGKKFVDFNTEQQGDICRDYYNIVKGNSDAPPNHGTGAWDPYIAEVKGTRAGADVTGTIRGGDRFTPLG